MKATLTPTLSFILRVGNTGLGSFHVESEWHGLTRLVSDNDPKLTAIVKREEGVGLSFSRALNPVAKEDALIVLCSPQLLEQLESADRAS